MISGGGLPQLAHAELVAPPPTEAPPTVAALILADLSLRPIYTSDAATAILQYPNSSSPVADPAAVQNRLRAILQIERFVADSTPRDFQSGRRRYTCRSFIVEPFEAVARAPIVAIVIARRHREPATLAAVGRRFHLSQREIETVQHLIQGLTTKEAAQRMNISPNTVKQFVRLVMSKMGVTTRSGIIGKFVSGS